MSWSADGSSFQSEEVSTNLRSPEDVYVYHFKNLASVDVKVIKIYTLRWSGTMPSLRFAAHVAGDGDTSPRRGGAIGSEQIVSVLNAMKKCSMTTIAALEFLNKVDDARKAKVQEDVKRVRLKIHTQYN